MKIVKHSHFKKPTEHHAYFFEWAKQVETINHRTYKQLWLQTSLGKTLVWSLDEERTDLPALVVFPGFRTTPLFWDIDGGLEALKGICRVFLVETNGQPNPSDGNSPAIRSNDYGHWGVQVLDALGITAPCFVAGASFGGMVCAKIAKVAPQRLRAIFMLNPGGLQFISLSLRNLYYNLLPVFFPNEKNVRTFLNKAVFCPPEHYLSPERMKLIVDFECFALKHYRDKTEKPYNMKHELKEVKSDVYLFLGAADLLFPYKRSQKNAQDLLPALREVFIFENVGHGIETYRPALKKLGEEIKRLSIL